MPEAERLKQEQLSKDAKIASLEAELSRRDLQAEVIAKLDERRLPVSIADLVQYGDRDSTMERHRRAWAVRPPIPGSYLTHSPKRFRTLSKSKEGTEQWQ